MRKENLRCPMCGTMNYDVDLDATDGWTKCRLCKAVTCSMDEWKKHTSMSVWIIFFWAEILLGISFKMNCKPL